MQFAQSRKTLIAIGGKWVREMNAAAKKMSNY